MINNTIQHDFYQHDEVDDYLSNSKITSIHWKRALQLIHLIPNSRLFSRTIGFFVRILINYSPPMCFHILVMLTPIVFDTPVNTMRWIEFAINDIVATNVCWSITGGTCITNSSQTWSWTTIVIHCTCISTCFYVVHMMGVMRGLLIVIHVLEEQNGIFCIP